MILMIFSDFSNFWKQMKKKLIIMKKKIVQKIEFWATAQVYCKAKKIVL